MDYEFTEILRILKIVQHNQVLLQNKLSCLEFKLEEVNQRTKNIIDSMGPCDDW